MLDETTYLFYGNKGRVIHFGRSSTELLSYLILSKHRFVSQEELISKMWVELPTRRNRARLRESVWRINEKLKGEARIQIKKRVGYRIIGER